MTQRPAPEFSRVVPVKSLADGETVIDIEADADERAALARRFGLLALDSLTAKVGLTPVDAGLVRVHGALAAKVTQACVVTLKSVTTRVEGSFERLYGADTPEEEAGLITDTDTEESPPEPFTDGAVDVGEAVAEQLALELDPFPRAPGAAFDGFSSGSKSAGGDDTGDGGSFAVLARLKEKPK
jgi:uncharacterized metal-binding protein YceD (DUF177 family)